MHNKLVVSLNSYIYIYCLMRHLYRKIKDWGVLWVANVTFDNISFIRVYLEKSTYQLQQDTQSLSHTVLWSATTSDMNRTHNFNIEVGDTDCIGRCKSTVPSIRSSQWRPDKIQAMYLKHTELTFPWHIHC